MEHPFDASLVKKEDSNIIHSSPIQEIFSDPQRRLILYHENHHPWQENHICKTFFRNNGLEFTLYTKEM